MENKILDNYMLLIIPSWGDLLGYPTLGKYANQNVTFIESDPVIFLTCNEAVKVDQSGSKYFLFGLGYYFLRFGYEGDKYITDNRGLTGLVLSDFVYDMMATSKDETLNDISDIVIAEKIIKIPLDLSKIDTQNVFLKGILSRNVFAPFKNVIIEFLDKIKDNQYPLYQVQQVGYSLLTATKENFNEILVSEKLVKINHTDYTKSTAGLNQIKINSDSLLKRNFSDVALEIIQGNIIILRHIYSSIEFDQMDVVSFIQNARLPLVDKLKKISENPFYKSQVPGHKKSILLSARQNDDQIAKWPENLPRREKKDIESLKKFKEVQITPGTKGIVRMSAGAEEKPAVKSVSAGIEEKPAEKFELSFQKHHHVESKTLTKPPEGNANEILLYLKNLIEEDYEMIAIGKGFELARDNLRKIMLQSNYMWEMNRYANNLQRQKPNLSLNDKDKREILENLDKWNIDIEVQERKEKERLERERLEFERQEKERKEREKIEKEKLEKERKEREKIEKEKLEKERKEREKIEKEKLEKERKEREKIEKEKLEKERKEREKAEKERLEKQRKEREKLEKEKLEAEKIEREKLDKEKLEAEKIEKEKLEKERSEKEKLEKQRLENQKRELEDLKKQRKQRETFLKEQKKLEKRKEKERKKIEKLKKKQKKIKNTGTLFQ